jgi:hypothetical protein
MQAVIRLDDDFQDAWSRIPSTDELNERIEAMAVIQLA